jgi:cytochrome P450
MIRDFLVTQAASFEKFPAGNPNQKLFGNGLLTSEGALHKQQRRDIQPAFHRDRLRLYAGQMVTAAERLSSSWQSGEIVDASAAMNTLTLRVISESFFAVTDTALVADLGEQLHTMLSMVNRFVLPWGNLLMRLPLPSSRRYHRAQQRLDSIVHSLLQNAALPDAPETLTSLLLQVRHANDTSLTAEEIRDEIVTMIVAGHETVAVGLSWCLYLLASHPDLQDKLAAQITETLGNASPTIADYDKLGFLQHAFSESLRLFPTIWILGRRNLEQYSFANFTAPKGSIFLVCMADLHRRPEFFERPNDFLPHRWSNPTWPSYAYLPFGAGERRCIGERFAWMEGIFFLACLLKQWRFALVDQLPPATDPKLTLNPRRPIRLQILRR